MSRSLFLVLSLPDDFANRTGDPDDAADEIVAMLNLSLRQAAWARAALQGVPVEELDGIWRSTAPIMVGAIPCPQWLTPETLANLRKAAS